MAQSLKWVPLLSLEEIALRRLVTVLWNDFDILVSLMKLQYPLRSVEEWKSIINRMKNKIKKLELPELLTKRTIDVIRPIGLEIIRWGDFHEKSFCFPCIELFEQASVKLCFTAAGTVDDRRMAQEIVHCNKINAVHRYQMACSYWLEDGIPILWQELSQEHKEYFYQKNLILEGLQFSWPHICKGGQSSLDPYLRELDGNLTSFNQWAFEHSAENGYKATAEHFFQKLSHEEREASLMRSAYAACSSVHVPYHAQRNLPNVLHYLLLLMTPEQQTEIVEAHPVMAMSCFFEWSRRELFSENAGLIWSFLSPTHYEDLLWTLLSYDHYRISEFFKGSPLDFKRYILGSSPFLSVQFLNVFLFSEDWECIKLFFRSADVQARVEFVFHPYVLRLFHAAMARGKWRPVEVCLREATLSSEERKKLKKTFLESLKKRLSWSDIFVPADAKREVPQMNKRDPKLKSFFDFLDGTDASVEREKKGRKRKRENCSPE